MMKGVMKEKWGKGAWRLERCLFWWLPPQQPSANRNCLNPINPLRHHSILYSTKNLFHFEDLAIRGTIIHRGIFGLSWACCQVECCVAWRPWLQMKALLLLKSFVFRSLSHLQGISRCSVTSFKCPIWLLNHCNLLELGFSILRYSEYFDNYIRRLFAITFRSSSPALSWKVGN